MASDKERIKDRVYSDYTKETNMSFSQLIKWKQNPLSRKTELGTKAINITLRLKKKKKGNWLNKDFKDAIKLTKLIKKSKHKRDNKYITGTKFSFKRVFLKNLGYDVKKKR